MGVENGLSQGQPLWLIARGVGEFVLGSKHGRHAPKALIVVSERRCHIVWLVVVIRANLKQHGLCYDIIIGAVASEVPVVNKL